VSGGFVAARVDGEQGVTRTLRALQDAGVPRRQVEVLSEVPLPRRTLLGHMRVTRLLYWTLAGLVAGLGMGVFFSVITVWLYPLNVGNQGTIVPPILVIIYELTMFSIVGATITGFILEMAPWRTARRPYWRDVAEGGTYVVVETPPDFVESRIVALLEESGGRLIAVEEAAG
jgi:Protein of unknown function (DUF3341)